jgi:hypothetical protein
MRIAATTIPSAARGKPIRLRVRRAGSAAALALVTSSLLLAGCGGAPNRGAPAGTTVIEDGVAYSVQSSRELNPFAPDDRALIGEPASRHDLTAPGTTLVGVFLQARDEASGVRRAVAAPEMVSAEGQRFRPLRLPATNPFAWRGGRLAPGDEIPDPLSAAAEDPQGGAVLVYQVPADTFITDRPFVLRFGPDDRAASVQLDL